MANQNHVYGVDEIGHYWIDQDEDKECDKCGETIPAGNKIYLWNKQEATIRRCRQCEKERKVAENL